MIEMGGLTVSLQELGVAGAFIFFSLLVISDRLVWHTRLRRAEERAERWESIALRSLMVGAETGVQVAEVATSVLMAYPDPANPEGEKGGET